MHARLLPYTMAHNWELLAGGTAIVVVGSFNPRIFHPQWFAKNNLLPPKEAAEADIGFVNNEVAMFQTEWLNAQITNEKFVLECLDSSKDVLLRDLTLGVFTVLEHTPVAALGLNHNRHYHAPNAGRLSEVLERFAPTSPWNQVLTGPHLRVIRMEGTHTASGATKVGVKLEPSNLFEDAAFLQINQHFQLAEAAAIEREQLAESSALVERLQRNWEVCSDYPDFCADVMLS